MSATLRGRLLALAEEWDAKVAALTREHHPTVYNVAAREMITAFALQECAAALRAALSAEGRCACTHEAGDSPCPVHGMDEEYPREPSPPPTASEPRVVRYGPATSRCAKSEAASASAEEGRETSGEREKGS